METRIVELWVFLAAVMAAVASGYMASITNGWMQWLLLFATISFAYLAILMKMSR